jgi:hypothetical protein
MYRQFLLDLLEAQRYPTKTGYEQLKKYADDPDVFISYRNINKLGINPTNKYNTPYGIYCYNLSRVFDSMRGDSKKVPFAGEHPYIHVFRIKNQFKYKFIDDIYNYSSSDYDHDIEQLWKFIRKTIDSDHEKKILSNIKIPFNIIALYSQGSNHVAWINPSQKLIKKLMKGK